MRRGKITTLFLCIGMLVLMTFQTISAETFNCISRTNYCKEFNNEAISNSADNTIPSLKHKKSKTKLSIKEQVIYEGNDVTIKVKSIKKTWSGYDLKFYIENKSSLNLNFDAHSYSINGVMSGDGIYAMSCEVASGKKTNASLSIDNSSLKDLGIKSIKNIDILFWAYDNDSYMKSFETDPIHISTSLDDGTTASLSGENIYDYDGIKVDYLSSNKDNYKYIISNTTGDYFDFDISNISINDYTNGDMFYGVMNNLYDVELLNNCQYVITIPVDSDFKSENDIKTVEKIDFSIDYRPHGDYMNQQSTDIIEYNF